MGASVLVLIAAGLPTHPGIELGWETSGLALALAAVVVLLARRRFPFVVLGLLVVLTGLSVPTGQFSAGVGVAVAIATYSSTLRLDRRSAGILTVAAAALMLGAALLAGQAAPQHVLVILLGGAIGDAIRTQRAHVATITERAERAERTREALALQRVAEDRLSIARDLHDVVAHQIAVINLHAGLASSALRTHPEDAQSSLAIVKTSSRTVLTEIGDLLATLRDPAGATTGPPGLSQLEDVVRDFAVHGLEATVRTEGTTVAVPAAVDVTALRIIQEGLTNAHKHGASPRAHVFVEYLDTTLRITVANPHDPTQATNLSVGTGNGLLGMSERVESVRGTVSYGPDGLGTWMLVADLPIRTSPELEKSL